MRKRILSFSFIALIFCITQVTSAQTYYITTIAGDQVPGYNGDGMAATNAELYDPLNTGTDKFGNVYIADNYNARVRKINSNGIISTVAGTGVAGNTGDGGPATNAEIETPTAVSWDNKGNIYIADFLSNVVRRVDSNGIITTFAGTGVSTYSGDGGPASDAGLGLPRSVTRDHSGNIYICDQSNYRVRKVDTNGIITTIAGDGIYGYTGDGGDATDAELADPTAVAIDNSGNVYIADAADNVIREVTTNGIISTFAGTGTAGFSGDGGPATDAEFDEPLGVAVDIAGNIYIADETSQRIRQVDVKGIITTIAGTGIEGHTGDGGPATLAELGGPIGVSTDSLGNIYITEYLIGNNDVREITHCTLPLTLNPPAPPPICNGQSIVLTAGGGASYQWSPSTGLNTTSGDTVIANPPATVTYSVTGVDSSGCSATKNIVITVIPVLPLAIQPQSPLVCPGQAVTLSAPLTGSGYTWSPASTLSSSTGDSVFATQSITTVYTVTGTDSAGCSATGIDTVKVIPAPPLVIQPQSPSICPGTTVALIVPVSGSDYIWSPASSLSATQGNIVIATPTVTTTYNVVGVDSLNCSVAASDTVYVSNAPNKPTIMSQGPLLTSSATQGNQWIRNDTTLQGATNQTYVVTIAGWYEVVAENPANGCSTTSDSVYINPTGIEQSRLNRDSNQLSIYPNPTGGKINVTVSTLAMNVRDWNLQVIDVLGRTVYTISPPPNWTVVRTGLNPQKGTFEIDLSNSSDGVYFICVMNKAGRVVVPVVKE